MNRTTVILFSLFLLLGGYLYFGDIQAEKQKLKEKENAKKVFSFTPESIRKIEIIKKEGEFPQEITLVRRSPEKQKESWFITVPFEEEADASEVKKYIQNFFFLFSEDSFLPSSQDLTPFGLAAPSEEIRLFSEGEEQPLLFKRGKMNALSDTFYALRNDRKEVLLIPAFLKRGISRDLFFFRQKKLLHFQPEAVVRVDIKRRVKGKIPLTLTLRKEGEKWSATSFKTTSESNEDVRGELFSLLSRLEAEAFVNLQGTSLQNKNLFPPDNLIEIAYYRKEDTSAAETLHIGLKASEERYYAQVAGEKRIAETGTSLPHFITEEAEKLREHRLFPYEKEDIKEFKLNNGKESRTFQRKGNGWSRQNAETLLEQVLGLSLKSYSPLFYGDEPTSALTLEVHGKEGVKTEEIFVHHENNKKVYCVPAAGKGRWYLLAEEGIEGLFSLLPLLDEQKILTFNAGEVQSLQVRIFPESGEKERFYSVRRKEKKRAEEKGDENLDAETLLWQLQHLQGVEEGLFKKGENLSHFIQITLGFKEKKVLIDFFRNSHTYTLSVNGKKYRLRSKEIDKIITLLLHQKG